MRHLLIKAILFIARKLPEDIRYAFMGYISEGNFFIQRIFHRLSYFFVQPGDFSELEKIIHLKKVVIFGPSTDWNDLKQRPQHLARAFSELPGHVVLFCTNNQTQDSVKTFEKITDSLYVIGNFEFLRKRVHADILYLVGSLSYRYVDVFQAKYVWYDFPDEISFFPAVSKKAAQKNHESICRRADLITPSADFLQAQITDFQAKSKTCLVLNGVFPEDFILTGDRNIEKIIEELNLEDGKVVGFYGGLGKGWIDFELLRKVALSNVKNTLVLIGGYSDDGLHNSGLLGLPNVRYLGPKPYKDLKFYAQLFDVALIPFLVNDVTFAASPIKMFEYMVQGLPVLTTNLPECKKYRSVVVAQNHNEFLTQIDSLTRLRHDDKYIRLLQEEGGYNTWHSRVQAVCNFLYHE